MNLIELVPRDIPTLVSDAKQLTQTLPDIHGINVPDVLRLPTRSHTAAEHLLMENVFAVPHIRSMDRPLLDTLELVKNLVEKGLKSVLIVSGDQPSAGIDMFDVVPVHIISALKTAHPTLKVYAALDPYRMSFKDELAYCQTKIESGADGFFTQPFFDTRLASLYLEQLTHTEVFLGISPVFTEKSLAYWKNKNHVVFPPQFQLTEAYNAKLGGDLLKVAKEFNQHSYLMPITADPFPYVKSVFASC
jgi:methylenetetrahydrofolate reductase (NADPH)